MSGGESTHYDAPLGGEVRPAPVAGGQRGSFIYSLGFFRALSGPACSGVLCSVEESGANLPMVTYGVTGGNAVKLADLVRTSRPSVAFLDSDFVYFMKGGTMRNLEVEFPDGAAPKSNYLVAPAYSGKDGLDFASDFLGAMNRRT